MPDRFNIPEVVDSDGCEKSRFIVFEVYDSEEEDEDLFLDLLNFRINCLIGKMKEKLYIDYPDQTVLSNFRDLINRRRKLGKCDDKPITLKLTAIDGEYVSWTLESDVSGFPSEKNENYIYHIAAKRAEAYVEENKLSEITEAPRKRIDLTVDLTLLHNRSKDLFLLSYDDEKAIPNKKQFEISANGKPILIRTDKIMDKYFKYYICGKIGEKWNQTLINLSSEEKSYLDTLPFDKGIIQRSDPKFNDFLVNILKQNHAYIDDPIVMIDDNNTPSPKASSSLSTMFACTNTSTAPSMSPVSKDKTTSQHFGI